jgi:hypothetical protein
MSFVLTSKGEQVSARILCVRNVRQWEIAQWTHLQPEPRSLSNPQQMCLSQENRYLLLKKAKEKCPMAKTKSSQKEGMKGNDTNTYLQPRAKSLSCPQQMSSH